MPRGIAILGPTGSGKSALAMRIANALPVEIISVDSAQVYRGLDIGTAKPTPAERAEVAHHLIDIREPEGSYSAGEFRADVLSLLQQIRARGRVPLLAGGTMLYYRALFQGIAPLPAADAEVRAEIDARAAREGWPALHVELATRDPEAAARIHPHDAQRIQRALEVLALSGRPLRQHWQQAQAPDDFTGWQVAVLEPADRAQLHAVLAQRLREMLAAGFVEEVRRLAALPGLGEDAPVLRLVGYRQLLDYCRGRSSREQAAERALHATRQLAKRQLTWLRSPHLLPYGATVRRCNSFAAAETEQLFRALIEGWTTPC